MPRVCLGFALLAPSKVSYYLLRAYCVSGIYVNPFKAHNNPDNWVFCSYVQKSQSSESLISTSGHAFGSWISLAPKPTPGLPAKHVLPSIPRSDYPATPHLQSHLVTGDRCCQDETEQGGWQAVGIEAFLTSFEEDEQKGILSGVRPLSHFLGTADLEMDERTSLGVHIIFWAVDPGRGREECSLGVGLNLGLRLPVVH